MHLSRTSVALVAYSSTINVSGTYMTGVLGCRTCILMYVARHLKEQGFSRSCRSGFGVEMRISQAAAN